MTQEEYKALTLEEHIEQLCLNCPEYIAHQEDPSEPIDCIGCP